MPREIDKKAIYIGSSLDDLIKLGNIIISDKLTAGHIEREMSLLKCQANDLWQTDEERAYIFLTKYFNYYQIWKKMTSKHYRV